MTDKNARCITLYQGLRTLCETIATENILFDNRKDFGTKKGVYCFIISLKVDFHRGSCEFPQKIFNPENISIQDTDKKREESKRSESKKERERKRKKAPRVPKVEDSKRHLVAAFVAFIDRWASIRF